MESTGKVYHATRNFMFKYFLAVSFLLQHFKSLKQYNVNYFQFVWIGFNFVVFCKAFSNYHHEPEFYYLSKILGVSPLHLTWLVLDKSNVQFLRQNGLCVSRGTAPVLNLTMALITLPMCRSLNVALNGAFGRWSVRVLVFYLEKIKVLHLALGVGLIIVGGEWERCSYLNCLKTVFKF